MANVRGEGRRKIAQSQVFNIDNGAGATTDGCVLRCSQPIAILRAQIVYTTETAGTIAAGNMKLGTTVGGAELVAATSYTNAATVGSVTAMTLKAAANRVNANTPVLARHTGVVATPIAGECFCEIEYEELT